MWWTFKIPSIPNRSHRGIMDRNRTIVVMSKGLFSYIFLKGIYCPSGIFLGSMCFYAKHFSTLPFGEGGWEMKVEQILLETIG